MTEFVLIMAEYWALVISHDVFGTDVLLKPLVLDCG